MKVLTILFMITLLLAGCGAEDERKKVNWECENPSTDHIEFLGYYRTSSIPEVSSYSNSIIVGINQVQSAVDSDMEPFLHIGSPEGFFDRTTKLIDWNQWCNIVDIITPYLDKIAGIYIMDEPFIAGWYPPNGYSDEDVQIIVDLYKEYFPLTPVWINYAWINATRPIPANLDYISLTPDYDRHPGAEYQYYVNQIKANMHPGQSMFLIGDGYNWDFGVNVPNYWQEYKADIARDYLHIASCDESIIGIFTFTYVNTSAYSNAYHMPILQEELEQIYNEVFLP